MAITRFRLKHLMLGVVFIASHAHAVNPWDVKPMEANQVVPGASGQTVSPGATQAPGVINPNGPSGPSAIKPMGATGNVNPLTGRPNVPQNNMPGSINSGGFSPGVSQQSPGFNPGVLYGGSNPVSPLGDLNKPSTSNVEYEDVPAIRIGKVNGKYIYRAGGSTGSGAPIGPAGPQGQGAKPQGNTPATPSYGGTSSDRDYIFVTITKKNKIVQRPSKATASAPGILDPNGANSQQKSFSDNIRDIKDSNSGAVQVHGSNTTPPAPQIK